MERTKDDLCSAHSSPPHHFLLALRGALFPSTAPTSFQMESAWSCGLHCDLSNMEAETGGRPWVGDQSGVCCEFQHAELCMSNVYLRTLSSCTHVWLFQPTTASFSTSCCQDSAISPCCPGKGGSVRTLHSSISPQLRCVNSLDNTIIRSSPFPRAWCPV